MLCTPLLLQVLNFQPFPIVILFWFSFRLECIVESPANVFLVLHLNDSNLNSSQQIKCLYDVIIVYIIIHYTFIYIRIHYFHRKMNEECQVLKKNISNFEKKSKGVDITRRLFSFS